MSKLLKVIARLQLPEGATGGEVEAVYEHAYLNGQLVAGGIYRGKMVIVDVTERWAEFREITNTSNFMKIYGGEINDDVPPFVTMKIVPTGIGVDPYPIVIKGRPFAYPGGDTWDLSDVAGSDGVKIVEPAVRLSLEEAILAANSAAFNANSAADAALANTFKYEDDWEAGFYKAGSVVVFAESIWRANKNTIEMPTEVGADWDLLIRRGVQGVPGLPGTINGISATDFALYATNQYPYSEDPPSTWPRGLRFYDVRNGAAKAYPFDKASFKSHAATDGFVQQEAMVEEIVDDLPVTTIWRRTSNTAGILFNPWRKATAAQGLDLKRILPSNRIINGSGQMGTFGWNRIGDAVTYWAGYEEITTGTVLEYYRINNSAPLTANTGVGQVVPFYAGAGQVYIMVDSVAQLGDARLYVDFYNAANQIILTINEALKPGINTYGPYVTPTGTTGTANVYLLHQVGHVGDILSRFRISLSQINPALPSDTRKDVRKLYDDVLALKAVPPGVAQLLENSRTSAQPVTDYPVGESQMHTTGSGWPFKGTVHTTRPQNTADATAPRQIIYQSGGNGIQQRTAIAASPFWTAFTAYAEKGARGTIRFKDAGVPTVSNTVGALDGDEYVNLVNGDFYVRSGGAWPAVANTNLRGLPGVSSYVRERKTGGIVGALNVLVNDVWQIASPTNSRLELENYGLLGADNVMYAPGAMANVTGLGFDPGRNYYLGVPANGKNLFAFDSIVPVDSLPTQSQRLLVPGSTARGNGNIFFLNPSAHVIDVEPIAQLYKLTPLSFTFDTDLGPAGLNEFIRNIDQPPSGGSSGGGASIRVRQDGFTGIGTSYDTSGQPSPHIDGSGRRVFIRFHEYNNTLHTYTPLDWPETDDGEMLVAWQHHQVSAYRPGVGFVMTGDHTAPSLYIAQFTGTNVDFRRRTTVSGVPTETNILSAAAPVASDVIQLTRVRKQGSSIKIKNWVAPDGWHLPGANLNEPAIWQIDTSNTSIVGSGRWGMMSHHDFMRVHAMSLATLDGAASF